MMTIDVVQALELLEICADEITDEEADIARGSVGRTRMSLTARALAKTELNVAHLARFPHRGTLRDAPAQEEPPLTLGALIVFRTAHKFGRAGASTERTIDAVYHAMQRYVELLPHSLQDQTDTSAICTLLAEEEHSPPSGRRERSLTSSRPLTSSRDL